jgi:hypothetical protein
VFEEFFREALASGGALIAIASKDGRGYRVVAIPGYDRRAPARLQVREHGRFSC